MKIKIDHTSHVEEAPRRKDMKGKLMSLGSFTGFRRFALVCHFSSGWLDAVVCEVKK